MTQPYLFTSTRQSYPNSPGYKRAGTSQEAAETIPADKLRGRCMKAFAWGNYTADQIATILDQTVLNIRPRISELAKMGYIEPTGKRRKNRSGKSAIVWRRV